MTQPPNEPPQGGFGAPQDPPPEGFGAPPPTPPPSDGFSKQQQPAAPSGPSVPPTPPPGGYGSPPPPPPGGFGAPQTPPGGYGAPQTPPPGTPPQGMPPQDPAYGYPQTPPPGPTQPGYGFPQQGYGYPSAPTQPQYAVPQPGGNGAGGGKKFNTQMQIITAAAVAIVLIIGGGIIYSTNSGDSNGKDTEASSAGSTGGKDGGDKAGKDSGLAGGSEKAPASTKSEVGFQVPQPKVTDIVHVDGAWLTGTAFVKPGVNEITAYDVAKGTKLWAIPTPGQICASSRHMSKDFKTAILFEESKVGAANKYPSCNQVGALDLTTGKLLWSKSVTSAAGGDKPLRFDEVTVSGNTVAAGGTSGGAAFNLTTGAELWKPKDEADGCEDKGYGGGEALVAVRKCGTYDAPQLSIQPLNPTTGAPLSSYSMPAGVEYAHIISTKPLVVAADVGDTANDGSSISDFFSIDAATGKLTVRISADAKKYAGDCDSTAVEKCTDVAVGNNRIYVPTEEHDGTSEYGKTNELVAFDLTTGKLVGGKADAGERYRVTPLRMDGTNVIAYKAPPYDKGGQIVSIDGATFKETVLMENPGDEATRKAESQFSAYFGDILYADGRMFLSRPALHKPSTVSPEDVVYLVVCYSTS